MPVVASARIVNLIFFFMTPSFGQVLLKLSYQLVVVAVVLGSNGIVVNFANNRGVIHTLRIERKSTILRRGC